MIHKEGNEVTDIRVGGRVVSAVRKGVLVVWEAVRSCFGKGFWINDKPWNNKDGWKNK